MNKILPDIQVATIVAVSVAVENFFERSEKFKAHQPELYRILVQIFKQDPTQFYASQSKQKSLFR